MLESHQGGPVRDLTKRLRSRRRRPGIALVLVALLALAAVSLLPRTSSQQKQTAFLRTRA